MPIIYVPTLPRADELARSRALLLGAREGGLAVLLPQHTAEISLGDVAEYHVILQVHNFPIHGCDFLHNPAAVDTVMRACDLFDGVRCRSKRVTFHLNSLVPRHEYLGVVRDADALWHDLVSQRLSQVARYAASRDVSLLVETVPVPEFGDLTCSDGRSYAGVPLRDLRNPFVLTHAWGFAQLRDLGFGICLDLCHNRTIAQAAVQGDPYGLLPPVQKTYAGLWEDVRALRRGDLIHLNDGAGAFTPTGGTFQEGVALGAGDIVDLDGIIRDAGARDIDIEIEVHEDDYVRRPHTLAALGRLLDGGIHF